MPRFNRDRAKAELGWDDAQIDAYLASPQGRIDSTSVTPPQASPEPAGGSLMGDVSGMAASALDAIGGPKTLLYGGAGVGALAGAKKIMGRLSAPPAAAPEAAAKPRAGTPRRGAAKHPPSLVAVTKEDIKNFPQLKNYKPGQTIRRARMEDIKMRTLASQPGTAQSRVPPADAGPVTVSERDVLKGHKIPTRPISIVEGGEVSPASAPAQTKDPRYTGGRGASGPELDRRAAAMERYTGGPAPRGGPRGIVPQVGDDLESQLRGSSELNKATRSAGLTQAEATMVRGRGAAMLRGAGGGLAALLPFLLGSQDIPQQMDDARRVATEGIHLPPSVRRALLEELAGL